MPRLNVKLLLRFEFDEPHRRASRGLRDPLGMPVVAALCLDVRAHVLRPQQPDFSTSRFDQATAVMCSTASSPQDHAGWKLRYVVDERLPPHRPANDVGLGSVDSDYTAGFLALINTKDNNRHLPTLCLVEADNIPLSGNLRPP